MLKRRGTFVLGALIALFALLNIAFAAEEQETRVTAATTLGGVAFLLMTSSAVLSTRLGIFEDWFGGLDRMYQVHRVSGVFAAIIALVHFFLAPKELPAGVDPAANPLAPSSPLGMLALIVLVIGIFVALNRKISYSRWRPTHRSMILVYLLIVGHFVTVPDVFFKQLSPPGLMLMGAALIGVISAFYSLFGMNRRTALPYTIEAVNRLERATEVVLKPVTNMITFKPGQFAFVEINGKEWNEPHPFTISSAPGEDRLRFTMKVLGDWTRRVREDLNTGGTVQIRGPYGRFDTLQAGKKQIWLAGGIGITPFLSMLRAMKEDDDREVTLVYAVREEPEALFIQELAEISYKIPAVRLVPLFSNQGQFASVEAMKENLPETLNTYEYFMCGPKPMVDGLLTGLKKAGVDRSKIHTEAFEFR